MVGREFVPNEDMGEWIVHLDAPEGTSLEGSAEIGFKLVRAMQGIEGVAAHRALHRRLGRLRRVDARSPDVSGAAARPAQEHASADDQRDAPAPRGVSRRTGRASRRATRSAAAKGTGGFAISANILGPDLAQIAEYSTQGARRRRRSCPAWPTSRSTSACRIPKCTSPWIASALPTSACGWPPSATRCGWRCRATIRSRSTRKAPEQYPVKMRVLEEQRRDIEEIGRLTVPSATGPVRIDNIATLERGARADRRCSARTVSSPSC